MTTRSDAAAVQSAQPETVALFVSDVHLQASMAKTSTAFVDFLRRHAMHTQQLYLLGDLFEYWAGDDDSTDAFHTQIIDELRQVADAGVAVFWIAGNRDFLVGESFARSAVLTLLPDPFVTTIAGRKLLLTHGDALCTDDAGYMAFRSMVRDPAWQRQFLDKPLVERKAIIAGMREASRREQSGKTADIMDVNPQAVEALFEQGGVDLMIHGHTHRPACHVGTTMSGDRTRQVLPDWDCDTTPPRGGWLALEQDGRWTRHDVDCPPL